MNRAERDALETAEHLKRCSYEAQANRRIDEIEAYVEGRKKTKHIQEMLDLLQGGVAAVKSPPHCREEACWEWHHYIDLNLDNRECFGSTTQRVLKKMFNYE